MADFFQISAVCLQFSAVCLQFSKKKSAIPKTHFGLYNLWSRKHDYGAITTFDLGHSLCIKVTRDKLKFENTPDWGIKGSGHIEGRKWQHIGQTILPIQPV